MLFSLFWKFLHCWVLRLCEGRFYLNNQLLHESDHTLSGKLTKSGRQYGQSIDSVCRTLHIMAYCMWQHHWSHLDICVIWTLIGCRSTGSLEPSMRDKIRFSEHSAQFISGIIPVDVFTKKWPCALLTLTITPDNDAWLETNNHILFVTYTIQ